MWTFDMNQRGISLTLATMMVAFVFTVGVVLISLTLSSSKADKVTVSQNRAKIIAEIGFEKAKKSLSADINWTDNNTDLFSDVAYYGGSYTVVLSNLVTHNITIRSVGTFDEETYIIERSMSRQDLDKMY